MKVKGRGLRAWARRSRRMQRSVSAAVFRRPDAVQQIRKEAKEHGATLANEGKGGLDPELALRVFRRDGWRCTNRECPDPKNELDLDHISGHPKEIQEDPEARGERDLKKGVSLGHIDNPDALHVLCRACHNRVHDRERSLEDGKEPKPMRGDRRRVRFFRTTHTVVMMELSKSAYEEIKRKIIAANYEHTFLENEDAIDMTGIGVRAEEKVEVDPISPQEKTS